MKIQKLAKAIKKSKHLQVVNAVDEEGSIFQMVGYLGNLYKIQNMPQLNDVQMLTFLGMAKEDKGKLNYKEQTLTHDIFLDDYVGEEQMFWSTLYKDTQGRRNTMPDRLDIKNRKARKAHTCSYCGDVIEKGEVYEWEKLCYEGQIYEWKSHKKCSSIASDLWDYADPDEGMTEDDFQSVCNDFSRTFICPDCPSFDRDAYDCEKDLGFCTDRIYEFLQTHDFKRVPGRPYEWKCYPKENKEEPHA